MPKKSQTNYNKSTIVYLMKYVQYKKMFFGQIIFTNLRVKVQLRRMKNKQTMKNQLNIWN